MPSAKAEKVDLAQYDVEQDVHQKFPLVWANLMAGKTISAVENPCATLLGGQPGAGKSAGTKRVLEQFQHNVLIINGDEFRPYHHYFDEIYALYGKEFSKYTGEFSGKMVEMIRNEGIKQRFNLLIEGTFRRAELPLQEIQHFEENGYQTQILICTCDQKQSWSSTLERAEAQQEQGLNPRYVPQEHHDLVVSLLAQNIEEVAQKAHNTPIEIYSRIEKCFDSRLQKIEKIRPLVEAILMH
ncbi:zeta toxin [Pasteurellaceae bacterium Macca]|nr:zeta toxin [Pasteurellaceae bacterium Macca]